MAKAKQQQSENPELEPSVIAAIVLADLEQIEADAETHQDQFAASRILAAVNRLREIATGNTPVS